MIINRTPKLFPLLLQFVSNMGRRRKKYSGPGKGQERGRGAGYTNIVKENRSFESYYKEQSIIPAEEWELLLSALKRPLPATFRITGFRGEAKQLLDFVRGHYIDNITTTTDDGQTIHKPVPLPWYPDQAAWQLNYDRQILRKVPALEKLHQFLVSETDSGNISRQELVSMIPPLLLDVKSNHAVLDMCAAPGSKTAQLIEALHADDSGAPSEGFVIGNDSDNKRCYIMVHQAKRLNSPSCLVVNHDARFFPKIFLNRPDGKKEQVMYDRILCDVPCSGDGTMRKNIVIWKQWSQTSALSLHSLQRQILNRGTELLDVGGKLVYSTCSFNPIENEAVVASVLKASEGSLHLSDVNDLLPGLKRRPGMKTWKVINETPTEYAKLEDVPEKKRRRFVESMWPPAPEEAEKLNLQRCVRIVPHDQDSGGFFVAVIEKTKRLPYEKEPLVKSVTPAPAVSENVAVTAGGTTEQSTKMESEDTTTSEVAIAMEAKDTEESGKMETDGADTSDIVKASGELCTGIEGGIAESTPEGVRTSAEGNGGTESIQEAVTENKADGGPVTDVTPADETEREATLEPPQKKIRVERGQYNCHKEDPFVYFEGDESIWPDIQKFYDISSNFPVTQLLTRSFIGKKRNLYFTSKKVKDIIEVNQSKLKVINSGIKTLTRSESDTVDCAFRLSQEGITSLFPYMGARKVLIDRSDVINLLSTECPFDSTFSKNMQEQMQKLGQGSLVFVCDADIKEVSETSSKSLIIVGWKGKMSVRSYLDRNSREHYLRMFGVEIPKRVPRPPVEALKIEASGDDEGKKSGQTSTESETERTEADAEKGAASEEKTVPTEGPGGSDVVPEEEPSK